MFGCPEEDLYLDSASHACLTIHTYVFYCSLLLLDGKELLLLVKQFCTDSRSTIMKPTGKIHVTGAMLFARLDYL